MADLIDRDAVLSKLKNHADLFKGSTVHDDIVRRDEATAAIAEIINAPAVNRWISCIQRLPEPLQTVIVCTDINTVTVAWLNGDHWTFADTGNGHTENWSFDAVKFWMPLPEPPESEVQNER